MQSAQRLVAHIRGQACTIRHTDRRDGLQAVGEHNRWQPAAARQRPIRIVVSAMISFVIIIIIIIVIINKSSLLFFYYNYYIHNMYLY